MKNQIGLMIVVSSFGERGTEVFERRKNRGKSKEEEKITILVSPLVANNRLRESQGRQGGSTDRLYQIRYGAWVWAVGSSSAGPRFAWFRSTQFDFS